MYTYIKNINKHINSHITFTTKRNTQKYSSPKSSHLVLLSMRTNNSKNFSPFKGALLSHLQQM